MAMAPVSWQIEFLGLPLRDLTDDHLPTVGEMFRYFQHHRQTLRVNEAQRSSARLAVARCIEIWKKFGIPTALDQNLTRIFLRLLGLFKGIFYRSTNSLWRKRKEILWRRKLNMVFNAAAKDAMRKCSSNNKIVLRTIEKEARELQLKEDVSLRRKAERHENTQSPMKKCKVVLLRMAVRTDAENELRGKHHSTASNVSRPVTELCPSSIELQPEDEDTVPPNLPAIIVKEEIEFSWDDNDNVQMSF